MRASAPNADDVCHSCGMEGRSGKRDCGPLKDAARLEELERLQRAVAHYYQRAKRYEKALRDLRKRTNNDRQYALSLIINEALKG